MLELTAMLCLKQTVTVLDCGNRADMYAVARHLRPFTHDPVAALGRIRLSRAFTGYQTVAMFEAATSAPYSDAVLVLDILPTFLDEDLELEDAQRLFDRALDCLNALSRHAPVVISAKPIPTIARERGMLLDALREQADFCWEEPPNFVRYCDAKQFVFVKQDRIQDGTHNRINYANLATRRSRAKTL